VSQTISRGAILETGGPTTSHLELATFHPESCIAGKSETALHLTLDLPRSSYQDQVVKDLARNPQLVLLPTSQLGTIYISYPVTYLPTFCSLLFL
jgi:hypothetical protein